MFVLLPLSLLEPKVWLFGRSALLSLSPSPSVWQGHRLSKMTSQGGLLDGIRSTVADWPGLLDVRCGEVQACADGTEGGNKQIKKRFILNKIRETESGMDGGRLPRRPQNAFHRLGALPVDTNQPLRSQCHTPKLRDASLPSLPQRCLLYLTSGSPLQGAPPPPLVVPGHPHSQHPLAGLHLSDITVQKPRQGCIRRGWCLGRVQISPSSSIETQPFRSLK